MDCKKLAKFRFSAPETLDGVFLLKVDWRAAAEKLYLKDWPMMSSRIMTKRSGRTVGGGDGRSDRQGLKGRHHGAVVWMIGSSSSPMFACESFW